MCTVELCTDTTYPPVIKAIRALTQQWTDQTGMSRQGTHLLTVTRLTVTVPQHGPWSSRDAAAAATFDLSTNCNQNSRYVMWCLAVCHSFACSRPIQHSQPSPLPNLCGGGRPRGRDNHTTRIWQQKDDIILSNNCKNSPTTSDTSS